MFCLNVYQKVVAKKPAPKVKEDSSSEDESSDEELAPVKNQPAKSSSSEDGSSSDEDEEEPAPVKKPPTTFEKAKAHTSSSEDESSSDEEEAPAPVKKQPTTLEKQQPTTLEKAKAETSSSEDESSSDEEEAPAPVKKQPTTLEKAKAETSSSEDESSSDEEEAPAPVKKQPTTLEKAKAETSSSEDEDEEPAPEKKPPTTLKKAEAESSSSGDESSSDDEPALPKKQPEVVKPAVKDSSSSEDDSDSDEESEDEKSKLLPYVQESDDETPPKKKSKVSSTKTSKQESSIEESDGEESEDEKVTPKKKDSDVKMLEAEQKSNAKQSKTPATQTQGGSKTLFVKNLSYAIERSQVENFFKEAGEVVDVRLAYENDRFRGFGHVEFASGEAAQKALELHGKQLLGRDVWLDFANEKRGSSTTPRSSNPGSNYQTARKGEGSQSKTIYVKGFDTSLGERETRDALREHFSSCGKITRIAVPNDRETGVVRGMAYIDFESGFDKALELNGSEFGGRYIVVNEAAPRADNSGDRPVSSGRNQGGRNSNRWNRGGRDSNGRNQGGRNQGRGRTPNKPSLFPASQAKKITFDDDE
ncbi:unnamed protein product [Arabis nemorensis]|uniref:RRM domain-containing protein n=1 Tax=Arabis nemorensis TaxID=586526 RepID=A0A565B9B5_9BRAS|nr:unnamed protein product [Arabis nemorensis]